MARRLKIQGICNDLLESFVSRYNDLNGYWALGVFQDFLHTNPVDELCFDLMNDLQPKKKPIFFQTSKYYHDTLKRYLKTRKMPFGWVETGCIKVRRVSPIKLARSIEIKTDLGRVFESQRLVVARPHDAKIEQQTGGKFGPSNQKGQ